MNVKFENLTEDQKELYDILKDDCCGHKETMSIINEMIAQVKQGISPVEVLEEYGLEPDYFMAIV